MFYFSYDGPFLGLLRLFLPGFLSKSKLATFGVIFSRFFGLKNLFTVRDVILIWFVFFLIKVNADLNIFFVGCCGVSGRQIQV